MLHDVGERIDLEADAVGAGVAGEPARVVADADIVVVDGGGKLETPQVKGPQPQHEPVQCRIERVDDAAWVLGTDRFLKLRHSERAEGVHYARALGHGTEAAYPLVMSLVAVVLEVGTMPCLSGALEKRPMELRFLGHHLLPPQLDCLGVAHLVAAEQLAAVIDCGRALPQPAAVHFHRRRVPVPRGTERLWCVAGFGLRLEASGVNHEIHAPTVHTEEVSRQHESQASWDGQWLPQRPEDGRHLGGPSDAV